MNDELRQMVIDALQRGEELPGEWARILFPPEKREYELVYYGKEREEGILADTMAVPLQPVSTFGKNGDGWHNKLIFGDNLQAMKTLLKMKEEGKLVNADGTPGVRLIYIDPPFATKQEFRGTQDQKAYQDKIAGAEFIEFLRKRLIVLRELLSNDGSIYLHLDTKKSHYMKVVMDEIFGESNFTNEIVWKRTSAHSDSNTYANVHDCILFYSRTASVFKPQYLPYTHEYTKERYKHIETAGRRKGQRFADDNLIGTGLRGGGYPYEWNGVFKTWRCPIETMREYERENRLYYTRNGVARIKRYVDELPGVPPLDIWVDIFPVNSQAAERVDYPTQKPESLLDRIIRSSSAYGDIVIDAFAGSGTTCAVAERLGRRWIGIDCGKLAIYTIQKRLLTLKSDIGNKGKRLSPKPFTLYNAGLYDFSTLKQLPWDDWRFFALQLFGCKDEPHEIGGLKLDGKHKGASVLVFNHLEYPGKRIDEETIESVHSAVGKKISNRFFIVAPKGVFDFQQDYIDHGGIRYYALRIPYSIINELHHREFTALQQPSDETAVNETVDAVGFDFIQPPKVDLSISVVRRNSGYDEACLAIKSFESRARLRGKDTRGELETFSMLMLDYDYNGKVFNMDAVVYAHQLQDNGWQTFFPLDHLGTSVMVVFVDIYGNETREVIARDSFAQDAALPNPKKKKKARS